MFKYTIINNDSLLALKKFPDNYFGSIVTDPPYGLKFMNSKWDYDVPSVELWKECLRVLKPGGHLLSFCGTRTQHRMVINIEDAGFEIRDVISWIHGQGFPKSLNVAKQIEAVEMFGNGGTRALREIEQATGGEEYILNGKNNGILGEKREYARKIWNPSNSRSIDWGGWGTALKPACEFITMARKPISEKNIALNVLKWGVGGINIDDTRIELNGEIVPINYLKEWSGFGEVERPDYEATENRKGRFPANLILDEESSAVLDAQSGILKGGKVKPHKNAGSGFQKSKNITTGFSGDGDGGASRFFYCAKPSKKEKNFGLDSETTKNLHPTVKPVKLITYLITLVTPLGEKCLDPFCGSGTTGVACKDLGVEFVGIEREKEYADLSKTRIENW